MVLKGVEEIDWFTDRPFRSEGLWNPQKLISQWDSFFKTSEPNAQASFKVGKERDLITFEMFKPKYNKKRQRLSFKIDAEIINERENDLVTGIKGKALNEITLFIDDAINALPQCFPDCQYVEMYDSDLASVDLSGGNFDHARLTRSKLANADLSKTDLSSASLTETDLTGANLSNAIMSSTNVTYANLKNANLKDAYAGAYFTRSKLNGANLTHTNLSLARMQYADLSGAKMIDAVLVETNLKGADMTGADLTGAYIYDVIWDNTTCPDGTKNSGTSPCTADQLLLT